VFVFVPPTTKECPIDEIVVLCLIVSYDWVSYDSYSLDFTFFDVKVFVGDIPLGVGLG